MVRLIIFAKRKDGMSKEEFRDYYENKHVPLVKEVLGKYTFPDEYTRSYIDAANELTHKRSGRPLMEFQYDAIVHFVFNDPEKLQVWFKAYEENLDRISQDESQFVERSQSAVYIADDQTAESP